MKGRRSENHKSSKFVYIKNEITSREKWARQTDKHAYFFIRETPSDPPKKINKTKLQGH